MRTLTVLAVAAVLLLAACNRGGQVAAPPTGAVSEPAHTPATTPAPDATTSPASTDAPADDVTGQVVELWFVREHKGELLLEPELHTLDEPATAIARATLSALFTAAPDDPALANQIPEETRLLDVRLDDDLLVVDLDFPGDGLPYGANYEGSTYEQIVRTGAQFPSVRRVRILEQGDTPTSGHLVLDRPMRANDDSVSPIVITSPAHGEEMPAGDVTVSGSANVFEANVTLRLLDPDGEVVEETFTTATCGTGCRGTWEHTFPGVTTPGEWTIEASEDDASGGGEGPPPFTVQRTFVVD